MTDDVFWLLVGLAVLVVGAELFIRGASALARALRVSELVIGLTIVAFGTSAPELAVSISATYSGASDIAIGNVVGSNICNVLLILGVSALLAPLVIPSKILTFDAPLMVGLSFVLLLLGWDGRIDRIEGLGLVMILLAYSLISYVQGRRQSHADAVAANATRRQTPRPMSVMAGTGHAVMLTVGLGMLVLGSQWMVAASVEIAKSLGVSELIIGLTIVAVGTSMPEMATSVLAALRGKSDLAVGNIVGSNIFNISCILGFSTFFSADGLAVSSSALMFDIPVMIGVAVACLPVFYSGWIVSRFEGALFLMYYGIYVTFLYWQAKQHDELAGFSAIMLLFVIPLTVLLLLSGAVQQWFSKKSP